MAPSFVSFFSLFVIGLPLGAAIAWIISQKKNKTDLATSEQKLRQAELNLCQVEQSLRQVEQSLRQAEQSQHQKDIECARLQERLNAQEAALEKERLQTEEKIQLLQNAEEQLTQLFKNLAN